MSIKTRKNSTEQTISKLRVFLNGQEKAITKRLIYKKPGSVYLHNKKTYDSSTDASADGWIAQNQRAVSSGAFRITTSANDKGAQNLITLPAKAKTFKFRIKMYTQPSQWGGGQNIICSGGDFVSASASADGNYSSTNCAQVNIHMNSTSGYTGNSNMGMYNTSRQTPVSGQTNIGDRNANNGIFIWEIEKTVDKYFFRKYNSSGTLLQENSYNDTRMPTQFGFGIRYGLTSENYNYVDELELTCEYDDPGGEKTIFTGS